MEKKLFVGNINWDTSEEEFKDLFAQYGEVSEAIIIKDRDTGRAKWFGFVTFTNGEDADKAIKELNGTDHNDRPLVVNEAKPKVNRNRF